MPIVNAPFPPADINSLLFFLEFNMVNDIEFQFNLAKFVGLCTESALSMKDISEIQPMAFHTAFLQGGVDGIVGQSPGC